MALMAWLAGDHCSGGDQDRGQAWAPQYLWL